MIFIIPAKDNGFFSYKDILVLLGKHSFAINYKMRRISQRTSPTIFQQNNQNGLPSDVLELRRLRGV